MTLLEKIRARREQWVKAGEFEFKLRRPTRLEMSKISRDSMAAEFFIPFVCDWKNVTENDIIGGGGSSPVPFESDAWAEWIGDRPDLWPALLDALAGAVHEYNKTLETSEKN